MAVATDQQRVWERRMRPRAGGAAIAAGVLTLVGALLPISYQLDMPSEPLLRSLAIAAQGRESSIEIEQALYFDDHALELIGSGVLLGLGALAMLLPLLVIARATQARTDSPAPTSGRLRWDIAGPARVLVIAAPLLIGLAQLVGPIGRVLELSDFAGAADKTADAAHDALEPGIYNASVTIGLLGTMLLGFATVVISLQAMRVGLLSRFMGVLGIMVGVLWVLPIGSQLPIIPAFWLIAVGLLLLGVGKVPPAWQAGEAMPWPSTAQLRDQRQREFEQRRTEKGGAAKRDATPAADDADGEPARPEPAATPEPDRPAHPVSKKKKRKRR